ncbi:hypothetical protein [Corynebacterium sp.]|uniref:hypothetical protein n=1 Tax=Corynebacterium sp. TaxID=1720 RepID=UPI003B3ABCD0
MPVQVDQARLMASVGKLDQTGSMVTKAAPAAVPWVVTGLTTLIEYVSGMTIGGGGGGKDDDADGDGKGDRRGGGGKGAVGEVFSTLRDYAVGISGGLLANKLGEGSDEHEDHEESVDSADESLQACDRVLESIQSLCADEVESCVDGAVETALGLYTSAKTLEPTDPVTAKTLLQMAAELLCSTAEGVESLVDGRNTQMGECMDLTIEECRPAADEGQCRTPLASDPAPVAGASECDVAPVPQEVTAESCVTTGVTQSSGESGVVVPAVAAATATASAGVGLPPMPAPCPPSVQLPDVAGEVSGWVRGAVEGAVNVVVENAGSLIDIDLNLCPPGTPDVPDAEIAVDCEEPEPEPCEPEPEPCEPEPQPEPEPCDAPEEPPSTVDPDKGFDKSGYVPGAVAAGESAPAEPPAPAGTTSPPQVETAAVGEATEAGTGAPEETDVGRTYDGWAPDVWTTGEKSAEAPSVERSGQW